MKYKAFLIIASMMIISKSINAQGGYMGITMGNPKSGMLGLRVGTVYKGFIDGYLSLYPQIPKWNNPGFYGGTLKIPFYYWPLIQNYESALGLEFLRLGKGISFAIPIEIGYGKLHFNQDFASQTPDPQTGYMLNSNLYLMTGFKIFLSFSSCDNYIEKLRNGN